MKAFKPAQSLIILAISFVFFGFSVKEKTATNVLTYGGSAIVIEAMDCSTDNSSDGKSRAIAAINMSKASSCIIQFGGLNPASGTYATVAEEPIGAQQILIGLGGSAFGGTFTAVAGQKITVTNVAGKYRASFKDITFNDENKKVSVKKLTGDIGCD